MTRTTFGVSLAILFALFVGLPAHAQITRPGMQQPRKLDKQVTLTVKSNYLLYLPKEYGKDPAKKWPMIVFLHGSGERGSDLNALKLWAIPKMIEQKKDFEFVIVSPQCPADDWWEPKVIAALTDDMIEKFKVDPDRVYLTGLSMGGFGTWATAIEYPDKFAAIAPICGGGNPYMTFKIKNVPTWVFHGEKDQAVPIAGDLMMAQALKQSGGDVQFTRYPELGHQCWEVTYSNPKLYEWFLEHKRGQKPTTRPAK